MPSSNRAVGLAPGWVATVMVVVIALCWGFAFLLFAVAGLSPSILLLGGAITAVAALAGLISWAADVIRYAD